MHELVHGDGSKARRLPLKDVLDNMCADTLVVSYITKLCMKWNKALFNSYPKLRL
jgi:hypothetical protein